MKIDNIDEVEEFAKEMNYFFTYIERTNSDLKNELRIKELEQDDLLHEIELSKLNAFELSKVAVRLRDVRHERRGIKDKLEFISTLKGFADKYNNKLITGDIAQLLKNIRNLKENWETRIYKTRVLEDLKISKMKKKVVMEEKEDEDITYKEIMKIIIENATEEGCHQIFSYGGIDMCPSDIFKSEIIDKKKEEDICNYESIGCTKCWTNAVKKIRKEKKLYE